MAGFTKRFAKMIAPLRDISGAFFNLKKEESVEEKGKKVAVTAARRIVYAIADYWLTILSAVLVVTMKALGYDFLYLFFAMWAYDLIIAGAFVIIWKRTGNDLTLGEDYRRAVDVVFSKSRLMGILSIVGILIKASFWDGPEYIVTFFWKEIKTKTRAVLLLLILTAIQSLFWTVIYSLGYDSISGLVQYLRGM